MEGKSRVHTMPAVEILESFFAPVFNMPALCRSVKAHVDECRQRRGQILSEFYGIMEGPKDKV